MEGRGMGPPAVRPQRSSAAHAQSSLIKGAHSPITHDAGLSSLSVPCTHWPGAEIDTPTLTRTQSEAHLYPDLDLPLTRPPTCCNRLGSSGSIITPRRSEGSFFSARPPSAVGFRCRVRATQSCISSRALTRTLPQEVAAPHADTSLEPLGGIC